MIDSLILLIGIVALWGVFAIAARRFERKRREEGAWDEHGPINPTWAPPNEALRAYAISVPTVPTIEPPPASDVPTGEPVRPQDERQ